MKRFARARLPTWRPSSSSGGEVTARSDIYSLGLVLYEIFTGQRALEGKNLAELIHKREQSGILPPTAIVKTLDPKIELAIMRCLKPQIDERPASALAVAAALPGGDPLAAALAAGETPSPELVAAAGQTDALHPAAGIVLVAAVVLAVLAHAALANQRLLYARVPMQRSLDSLEDRARDILRTIGFETKGADSARGLSIDNDAINHIANTNQSADRWDELEKRIAPVMLFWYRSGAEPLVPYSGSQRPTAWDPPPTVPGMAKATLDDSGQLVDFEAVPPFREDPSASAKPVPWPALFAAAGLDMGRFQPVEPTWVPRAYASERAAWEGPLPKAPDQKLRVEAAAHRGAPVFFKVVGPWAPVQPSTTSAAPAAGRFWRTLADVVAMLVLVGALLLARANLRAGRGDRRGAGRLFVFTMTVLFVAWLISARHYGSFQIEGSQFFDFVAYALLSTGRAWILYIALEPYVRRFSPALMISWTRVLGGQVIDPRVGRDVLVGAAVGSMMALVIVSFGLLQPLFGQPPAQLRATNLSMLLGSSSALGTVLRMIPNNLQNAMFVAVAFGFGRALTGRLWGGAVFAGLLLGILVMGDLSGTSFLVSLLFIALFVIPLVGTLVYFGLLAIVVAFLCNQALNNAPLTLDLSMPFAPAMLWSLLLVAGLTTFGFYASRGGQPLFGRLLQSDRAL